MIAISRLRIQSQELPSSAVCRSQWTETISVLMPVFSGFAVVMAIAPNETNHEESQLVPRQSRSSSMVQTAEIHRLTQRTGKTYVVTIRHRDKHVQGCRIQITRASGPFQDVCIHYTRLCVNMQWTIHLYPFYCGALRDLFHEPKRDPEHQLIID